MRLEWFMDQIENPLNKFTLGNIANFALGEWTVSEASQSWRGNVRSSSKNA